ncbi:MAG: carbohydrate-binding family 9-like protein [Phycisphaeraceae bacterium]|nr:carbohydrate-binding family 9-like protein [Phycisphaeraceae bacterium]
MQRASRPVVLSDGWDDPSIPTVNIDQFHPKTNPHFQPRAQARAVYDDRGLTVFFEVHDRYVRCRFTDVHGPVCQDACVEFFTQPKPDKGYFNFEVNCGGTMLLHYTQVKKSRDEKHQFIALDDTWMSKVPIHCTMPKVVDPEITEPVTWRAAFFAPWELFEAFVGPVRPIAGSRWTANFYKCASDNSHPHWGSWSSVGEWLNFHQPPKFAPIIFDP